MRLHGCISWLFARPDPGITIFKDTTIKIHLKAKNNDFATVRAERQIFHYQVKFSNLYIQTEGSRITPTFHPTILYSISEIFYNSIFSSQRQTRMSKQSFYPLKNKASDFLMNQNAHATYKSSTSKEIHHYFSLSLQHIHLNIFTNNLANSSNIVRRLCIINLKVHNL